MGLLLKGTAIATCAVWIFPVAFPDRTMSASINVMAACTNSQRLVSEFPTLLSAALIGWIVCYLSVQVTKTRLAHSYLSEDKLRTSAQHSMEKLPITTSSSQIPPETAKQLHCRAPKSGANAEVGCSGMLATSKVDSDQVDQQLETLPAMIFAAVTDATNEAVTCSDIDNERTRAHQERSETTPVPYSRDQDAHSRGECKPCAYFAAKQDGCRQGDNCEFCHLCDLATMKRRHKEKKKRIQYLKSCSRVAAVQASSPMLPGVRPPPGLPRGITTQHYEIQKYARVPLQRQANPFVPAWGGPTLLTAH